MLTSAKRNNGFKRLASCCRGDDRASENVVGDAWMTGSTLPVRADRRFDSHADPTQGHERPACSWEAVGRHSSESTTEPG